MFTFWVTCLFVVIAAAFAGTKLFFLRKEQPEALPRCAPPAPISVEQVPINFIDEYSDEFDVVEDTYDVLVLRDLVENMDDDELLDLDEYMEYAQEDADYEMEERIRSQIVAMLSEKEEASTDDGRTALLHALHKYCPALDPEETLRMIEQLDYVEGATYDGSLVADAPVLVYGNRRYVHFEPGTAYLLSQKLQGIVDDSARRTGMPPATVVASALMFHNKWYRALEEHRIAPLYDSFGNHAGEYLVVDINKELKPKTMAEVWSPGDEDTEVFGRARKTVRTRYYPN